MAELDFGSEFFVVGDRRENGRSQSWKFWWSFGKGLPSTEVTAGGRGEIPGDSGSLLCALAGPAVPGWAISK